MRSYQRKDSHLLCGHWNGSPVEIGILQKPLMNIPDSEVLHYHDYHEYYVVLSGYAELEVEGKTVQLKSDSIIMVEPGERHKIQSINPDTGARWVIIKEKSEPNSKRVVQE